MKRLRPTTCVTGKAQPCLLSVKKYWHPILLDLEAVVVVCEPIVIPKLLNELALLLVAVDAATCDAEGGHRRGARRKASDGDTRLVGQQAKLDIVLLK